MVTEARLTNPEDPEKEGDTAFHGEGHESVQSGSPSCDKAEDFDEKGERADKGIKREGTGIVADHAGLHKRKSVGVRRAVRRHTHSMLNVDGDAKHDGTADNEQHRAHGAQRQRSNHRFF